MKRLLAATFLVLGAASGVARGVTFQRLEFGGEAEHGIFAEDLDGDGSRDLIALGRGRIAVYRCSATGGQYPKDPELLQTFAVAYFADVADVHPAKGKEIVLLTPAGVACFVHDDTGRYKRRLQMLLERDTLLNVGALRGAMRQAALRFSTKVLPLNFAFDADGDGRDDILVPHGAGYDVHLQTAQPGKFAKPITLPIFPFIFHDGAHNPKVGHLGGHEAGRLRLTLELIPLARRDVNGDRKPDLVCGQHWFAQKLGGGFDPVPADLRPEDAPARNGRSELYDINGDRRLDRIYGENDLREPLNIVTYVHYFLADAQGRLDPDHPNGTIAGQNILIHTPLPVHDFSGDGALDFAMFNTDITVTRIAKWVRQSFGDIEGKLLIWYFDTKRNAYPAGYSYHKKIRMRFKIDLMDAMAGLVWERYLSTMMRFEGDYNGDGRLDLLVRERTHTIAIYLNSGNSRTLFPRDPSIVFDKAPGFGGLAVDDLNADGASDLILYRGSAPFTPNPSPNDVIAVYISKRK